MLDDKLSLMDVEQEIQGPHLLTVQWNRGLTRLCGVRCPCGSRLALPSLRTTSSLIVKRGRQENFCVRYSSKLTTCCLKKCVGLTKITLWSHMYSSYHTLLCVQCFVLQIQAKSKTIQELIAETPWIRLKKWMICLKLLFSGAVCDAWSFWRVKAAAVGAQSCAGVLDSWSQLEHEFSVTCSADLTQFNGLFHWFRSEPLESCCCPSLRDATQTWL